MTTTEELHAKELLAAIEEHKENQELASQHRNQAEAALNRALRLHAASLGVAPGDRVLMRRPSWRRGADEEGQLVEVSHFSGWVRSNYEGECRVSCYIHGRKIKKDGTPYKGQPQHLGALSNVIIIPAGGEVPGTPEGA